jgi:hypothetical protein
LKWEYLIVTVYEKWSDGSGWERTIQGWDAEEEDPNLGDLLDEIGAYRWELVSTDVHRLGEWDGPENSERNLYFKRPLADDEE